MPTINFDKIHEAALLGVRRASVFMGLGVNAADDERLVDYSLTRVSTIGLVPAGQPPEVVADFKLEFRRWIVANGLRELLEAFETFLSKLYDGVLYGEFSKNMLSHQDAQKALKNFDHKGLSDKVAILQAKGITGKHSQHLACLYLARNCLTHRQGKVGKKDCNDPATPDHLVLTWWAFDIEGHHADGQVVPLTEDFNGPLNEWVYFPDGGNVVLRVVERRLEVPIKSVLSLTPSQLAEMCMFVKLESDTFVRSAVTYLESVVGLKKKAAS